MHHSVESRTPFADDSPLMIKALNTAASYKIRNGTSKYILRESMKSDLPNSVYERKDKMGFVTPHNKWLTFLLQKNTDLLYSDRLKPFFSDRFFVKNDRLSKKSYRLKSSSDFKEETLTFKALVFTVWADLMKI